MSSTYSTSLKIQLMGNGDQATTWGTTTNTNWELIEEAVSGVVTITMANADYTLSNLNGVSDEARNMVLVVNGTNSAIRKVVAPLVEKFYVVSNQTTGGYAINIGGSTGSYVAIPNGVTAQVYCDGTNFYSAQTSSAGNFVVNGNETVDGNLSVAGTFNYVPTGTLNMWPLASAPAGFLKCDGSAVSRSTYSALYAVIGTTFGSGDGSTTFNLPNYTDRMPIGAGNLYAINDKGGSKDATLVQHSHGVSDPGHSHGISDPGHSHGVSDPGHAHGIPYGPRAGSSAAVSDSQGGAAPIGTYGATTGIGINLNGTNIGINGATTGISTQSAGTSATGANLPPYIGINFIIKT